MSKGFKVDVVDVVDLEDGGAMVTFDMDQEALLHFAGIGLKHVLITAVENDMVVNEEPKDD